MTEIVIRNRQRSLPIDVRRYHDAARMLLAVLLECRRFALGVHLVGARTMTAVNREYLRHEGPTDVITFDHGSEIDFSELHGELFICAPVALEQSKTYRTSWQLELMRYLVHGILHLKGHRDERPADRARMKREEDRLLRRLSRRIPPESLSGSRPPRPARFRTTHDPAPTAGSRIRLGGRP